MRHLPLLLLLGLALPLAACPSGRGGGDDDDTSDDDDATPPGDDDDDATPDTGDPCEALSDITVNVNASNVLGSTNGENDTVIASCSNGGVADAIFVFTAETAGTFVVSTDHEGTDFDTLLFAYSDCADPTGSELACNDDVADQVPTSTIEFEAAAGAEIYIAVEGYDGTGSFELSIEAAVCGDDHVASTEACDDGNLDTGDGCDDDCRWECVDDSREDDDTLADATDLSGALPATISDGVLCPDDESSDPDLAGLFGDWFQVQVTEDGQFVEAQIDVGGTLVTACEEQSLNVTIVNADLQAIAPPVESETGCQTVAAEPAPGTYYVLVFHDDFATPPQDYVLHANVGVSVCGDDVREGVEECDDGNEDNQDGCSATCFLEDAACTVASDITATVGAAPTAGTTAGGTDDHTPTCTQPGSADIVYELTLAADAVIGVSTNTAGTTYDTALHVREASCVDPSAEIACNDDVDAQGGNYNSELGFAATAGVPYYIIVDGYNGEEGDFELTLTQATCGDDTVDLGEACDDGNTDDGDGCQADCLSLTPYCEFTADDDLGTLPAGQDTTWTGDVAAATDNLPDLPCSEVGGGDLMLGFAVEAAGTLTFNVDHTGNDVQYAVVPVDEACELDVCVDTYPDETGQFTVDVQPGLHLLILETFEATSTGETTVVISVP